MHCFVDSWIVHARQAHICRRCVCCQLFQVTFCFAVSSVLLKSVHSEPCVCVCVCVHTCMRACADLSQMYLVQSGHCDTAGVDGVSAHRGGHHRPHHHGWSAAGRRGENGGYDMRGLFYP